VVAPLEEIRIVDLSAGIAGAVATMLLADFGAAVVKAEPPAGDPLRAQPGWATWQRGKTSVVIDERSAADRATLTGLLSGADVCVSSDAPAQAVSQTVLDTLLGEAAHTRLITLRMPPYLGIGPAPWAGGNESNELLSAAMGISMRQSSFGDGPVDPVYPHLLYEQGLWAAGCALAALVERAQSGQGQTVTVSGSHGALVAGAATFLIDPAAGPSGPVGPGGPNPCYTRYQCSDGNWLFLGALTPKFQVPAFGVLGLADIPDDPRMEGQLNRMLLPENRSWIRERMTAAFRTRPRDQWLKEMEQADVPAGPLLDRALWLGNPQIRDIGMRVEVEDPDRGHVVMPGIPLVLSDTPGAVRSAAPGRPADAGQVRWPVQADSPAEASSAQAAAAQATAAPGAGPLAGIRVLDLGTILAGPFAGHLLAELGADVIKVEPPGGDSFRQTGFIYNRGMRSIPLDLRSAEGKEIFYDLVRASDVVIDNYRPGVLRRLRIDYDSLAAVNPQIISLSITGFGEGGPLALQPGFDPILQGMSGMMIAQGADSEPVFLTVAVNDVTGGAMTAAAACLALYNRAVRGAGQRGRTSLDALAAFMQSGELTEFAGRPAARLGGRDFPGPGPLDRLYPTRNGWLRLQATESDIPALREAGLLATGSSDDGMTEELAAALGGQDTAEIVARLTALGIPAVPARATPELAADPALEAAHVLQRHERASGNPYFVPGRLAAFGRTQQTAALVAPGLGEHTRAILTAVGYDADRIDAVIAAGHVVEGPPLNMETFVVYR
jgi:crotonobetainyl-CoA:carnitine CoA-transferase CaiB-like acyl-CoA transferase